MDRSEKLRQGPAGGLPRPDYGRDRHRNRLAEHRGYRFAGRMEAQRKIPATTAKSMGQTKKRGPVTCRLFAGYLELFQ
jgi:hypothetical protein